MPLRWILHPRFGPPVGIKPFASLVPGEVFDESHSPHAVQGVMDALSLDEHLAYELYRDITHGSLVDAHHGRVDPHGWEVVRQAFLQGQYVLVPFDAPPPLVWGARVSAEFRTKLRAIAKELGVDPNYLMACMAFESAGTFSPSKRNAAGSGAVGLIQFMPNIARALGTDSDKLAALSAEEQLDYVQKYFHPHRGKLHSLEDVYMAILWPAAVGKPMDYVLFTEPSVQYTQNKGLDSDHDGKVTKYEAAQAVRGMLAKGAQFAR